MQAAVSEPKLSVKPTWSLHLKIDGCNEDAFPFLLGQKAYLSGSILSVRKCMPYR